MGAWIHELDLLVCFQRALQTPREASQEGGMRPWDVQRQAHLMPNVRSVSALCTAKTGQHHNGIPALAS